VGQMIDFEQMNFAAMAERFVKRSIAEGRAIPRVHIKVDFRCGCHVRVPSRSGRESLLADVESCRDHRSAFDRKYIVSQAFDARDAKAAGLARAVV
jgi:hypothetical protein